MKKLLRAAILVVIALVSMIQPARADGGQDVILLHGWNGNTASWDIAKAKYEAEGDTVHVLALPYQGWRAGETAKNAEAVKQYISSRGLSNVKLDGHSLGGALALYVAAVQRNPAVTSVVMRDTGITYGWSCFIVPDLCSTSAMWKAIKSSIAANPAIVPVLNVNGSSTALPGVKCLKVKTGITHTQFQTDAQVQVWAEGWSEVNPCG